jgi:hypothetical protein
MSYLLFLCTIPLGLSPCAAGSELVENAPIYANGFLSLNDYEILSVHDEGEEDVVRLRKRADEDCGTDCMNYSGWEADEIMHCDPEVPDEEDLLVERSLLMKRAGRKTSDKYR